MMMLQFSFGSFASFICRRKVKKNSKFNASGRLPAVGNSNIPEFA
jgi:hypothetical protein